MLMQRRLFFAFGQLRIHLGFPFSAGLAYPSNPFDDDADDDDAPNLGMILTSSLLSQISFTVLLVDLHICCKSPTDK